LVISQLTRFAVLITGANVIINVIGNIILLPRFGIKGAAIMTIISEFLQGLFYFYFIRKKITPFAFWRHLWRPFLASGIMGLALWQSRLLIGHIVSSYFGLDTTAGLAAYLIFNIVEGVIVYAVVLAIIRFFRRDDWQFIRNFFRPPAASAGVPTEPLL
jgi:peptidoglycan biosynthesis protein MviN/MurJ (putative lipid II flippase)